MLERETLLSGIHAAIKLFGFMKVRILQMRLCALVFCLISILVTAASAQTSGTLRGRITDPSGAVISGATVTATGADGKPVSTITTHQGTYELKGLAPGSYNVTATAKGFAVDQEADVQVVAGQPQQLDIGLQIEVEKQNVEVQEESPTVGVSPENSAGTLVIKGKDLDALSDDPDELSSELQALAGPSAGPNGGQIYVDGFTAGQLPPKSAIREIRINQNPFSAEYDKLGYGRIEVFTKPGTDQFHGQLMVNGNSSYFNSLNPFITSTPGYYSEIFNGNVSGPIDKKASFFFTIQQRDIDNVSVVVAQVLGPGNIITPYTAAVPSPAKRLNISPRVDFQLTPKNTLTVRYQYVRNTEDNEGIGQFSLPSTGFNSHSTEQTVQISDTQTISPTMVNETRFQYIRDTDTQVPLSIDPTIVVQGAFTGGGSSSGTVVSNQDHYELQNYTSIAHGKHFIKFGGRLRGTLYSSEQDSGFNGTYTFSSIAAYQNTLLGLGGGPSQFVLVAGQPLSDVSMVDVGLYVEDEWRLRPNITLSGGLRYETQTGIPYQGDWAPRLSLAWGLGHNKTQPKTVLRGGYGIFYDRFSYDYLLQAERYNGTTQQQYVVANPTFYPLIPTPAELASMSTTSPSVYQVQSNLRVPYTMEAAFSVERQVTKNATVSVTYLNSRGDHQLFLRNANAPLPGTYPPSDIRPFGGNTNIYQYNSGGVFEQNQLIANFRVSVGTKLSLFGFYSLNFANSDLGSGGAVSLSSGGGAGGFGAAFGGGTTSPQFVSNSYDPMEDYGRAAFDVRNRMFIGGTISLPYALRLSPFIIADSGSPFNIIVGQDLNGDSIFNDRPALSGTAGPGGTVYVTPYGTFNSAPLPGQTIVPINYGTGQALFSLNLRLSKTIGLGPKVEGHGRTGGSGGGGGGGGRGGGGGGLGGPGGGPFIFSGETNRKYNLTFSVSARNLLNNVNYAPPIGTLGSPLFGTSNALAGAPFSSGSANRRIDLQMLFSF
jgi:Carboxypeptidase regulatory-like domain